MCPQPGQRRSPSGMGGTAAAHGGEMLPALLVAAAALASCGPEFQFSQLEEFESARAALGSSPPTAAQRALLEAHRPEFHLPPGHEGMIDFYRDYIAHGRLLDADGRLVSDQVTRELLNMHKGDPGAEFTHHPPAAQPARDPAVYGGVKRGSLASLGGEFTLLSYHAVFRTSGLPADLGPVREFAARLAGDRKDWHQLDHYTAVFIALDASGEPRAVVLQHHNYMRTHVIRADGAFRPGEPVRVDVAVDSNELYPHSRERRSHRAAGFMNAETIGFLLGLTDNAPLSGSRDITEGTRLQSYRLEYLPPDDAFYVFQGYLGERRRLPGRDGPPGAIYNTIPAFRPPEVMLPAFYWREGDEEYARLLGRLQDWRGQDLEKILPRLRERFAAALQEAAANP